MIPQTREGLLGGEMREAFGGLCLGVFQARCGDWVRGRWAQSRSVQRIPRPQHPSYNFNARCGFWACCDGWPSLHATAADPGTVAPEERQRGGRVQGYTVDIRDSRRRWVGGDSSYQIRYVGKAQLIDGGPPEKTDEPMRTGLLMPTT